MTRATEPTTAATDVDARRFTMSIDVNATPEDVWRALTDAGELVRWFPLQARVTPGVGGTMFWGWDAHWAWESTIEEWQPGKRLTLVETRPAFDAKGDPLPGTPQRMAMEFTIETHEGRTRLRLVHAGFGRGANWDDELDSVSAGWQFELRGLRHYLEQHQGRDRHHAVALLVTGLPLDVVWQRLLSPAAFTITRGSLNADDRCAIRTAAGDAFDGGVLWHNPQRDLFLVADNLDGGVFRIATWRANDQTGVQVWVTTYSHERVDLVKTIGARMQPLIEQALQ
jgi:uncharacterized protein YndB with AHSA1/START domain